MSISTPFTSKCGSSSSSNDKGGHPNTHVFFRALTFFGCLTKVCKSIVSLMVINSCHWPLLYTFLHLHIPMFAYIITLICTFIIYPIKKLCSFLWRARVDGQQEPLWPHLLPTPLHRPTLLWKVSEQQQQQQTNFADKARKKSKDDII